MTAPDFVHDFEVLEWGSFAEPKLPTDYKPPTDGQPPLKPSHYVAICRSRGIDGFYTIFCATDWEYITGEFNETMQAAKLTSLVEFGEEISYWHRKVEGACSE